MFRHVLLCRLLGQCHLLLFPYLCSARSVPSPLSPALLQHFIRRLLLGQRQFLLFPSLYVARAQPLSHRPALHQLPPALILHVIPRRRCPLGRRRTVFLSALPVASPCSLLGQRCLLLLCLPARRVLSRCVLGWHLLLPRPFSGRYKLCRCLLGLCRRQHFFCASLCSSSPSRCSG